MAIHHCLMHTLNLITISLGGYDIHTIASNHIIRLFIGCGCIVSKPLSVQNICISD